MKNKLERITNLTINDLLNTNIILPSSYFEKFTYHAKKLEINLEDENFSIEINKLFQEDFNKIEELMKIIITSASTLKENTKDAKKAILGKDNNSLNNIYNNMILLENEVEALNNQIFIDKEINTYNRKWIYSKFLDNDNNFQEDGVCVLVDIIDYFYIQKEYKEILSKNLLVFAINFILKKLQDEDYEFKIARYLENKFFIFIFNKNKNEVINNMLNLEQLLSNTTLKSNSGLVLKSKYSFKTIEFQKGKLSNTVFESLLNQEKDK